MADGVFKCLNEDNNIQADYIYEISNDTLKKYKVLILLGTAYPKKSAVWVDG